MTTGSKNPNQTNDAQTRHRLFTELIELVRGQPSQFLDVLERALDGIWFWDIQDGNEEWMSPKFWTTFGYEPGEKKHLASEWQDLIFPEDLELAKVNIGRHLEAPLDPECRYDQIVRYKGANGGTKHIRCTGQAILDSEGKPYRVLGLHTDLTEKIKAQELKVTAEEMQRLRGLSESLPQLTWTCTAKGDCDYVSPSWSRYTGESQNNLIGTKWFDFVHSDDQRQLAMRWEKSVESGEPFKCDFRILGKDGVYRMFDTRALALKDDSGNVLAWFGSNTDIQDSMDYRARLENEVAEKTKALGLALKKAEKQKKQAQVLEKRAKAASLAKSRFLSTISHELRTPLNGISGITFTLQQTKDAEKSRDLLIQLNKATQHLNSLVSDVLEMSRIEEGRVTLNIQPNSIREVCESSLAIICESASHKGLEIRYEFDNHLPSAALFDDVRLKQILVNLLNNAVKFTDSGFIKLSCSLKERIGSELEIIFLVQDSGIGIAQEKLKSVFEIFEQADAETFSRFGGSGLGLGLVKGLTSLMGGTCGVTSELNKGSSFWVTVPFKSCACSQSSSSKEVTPSVSDWSNRHVLIVDDMEMNLLVLENILDLTGAKVSKAQNGQEAIDCLRKHPEIDLVLMDIHMPQMNGLEATREIRRLEGPVKNVRIVALTGAAMEEDRRNAMAAGMNDVLFKPVNPQKLLAL